LRSTDNEQEAQGWKPDGLLYQDFLVMLRVYLGWRFKAKITLTTRTDCWPLRRSAKVLSGWA
jgi:type VI secretion system protein ImpH